MGSRATDRVKRGEKVQVVRRRGRPKDRRETLDRVIL